jgi:hypothetical protein
MAFCVRCGQRMQDAAGFCSGCGSVTGREPADEPRTAQAMVPDYLRPFAPEGTQPAALRSAEAAPLWPAPAPEPGVWSFPSPAGQPPDFSPPPSLAAPQPGQDLFSPTAQLRPPGRLDPPDMPVQVTMPSRAIGELKVRRQAAQPPAPPARGHRGRWVSVAAALVVILLCGIGAAVLLSHHGKHAPATSAGARRPASRPASPTPTAAAGNGLLSLAPGVTGAPHAAAVERFVTRYFRAINRHDYAAYRLLFSTSLRGGLSAAAFRAGYGSSRDTQATLRSITSRPGAELDAVVTFTSHQRPARSPTHSSCTAWTISLYLVRQARGYVLAPPPAGYQARFGTC